MADSGYFLIADVLGFGKIVQNSTEQELEARIDTWVKLVESTAERFGIERIQLISDTLFASVSSESGELAKLIDLSRQLLIDGIEQSLPVRGAIVHGTFSWGKLTYGRAVIAAYELEQAQNWIGIVCSPELPGADDIWSIDRLICYPPPFKKAQIRLHPVVSWPVPTERLMRLLTGGGLTKKDEVLSWELGEKVSNTIVFQLYQKLLSVNGNSPSKFYGMLPVHPIAAVLNSG